MDDIDIKSYAGEILDSAAESHLSDQNSYEEDSEYPVHKEFLDAPEPEKVSELAEIQTKQEHNFRALREEIDRVKAEKDELRQNLEMMRANLAQRPPPVEHQEKKMFDGLDDYETPNVSQIRQEWEKRESGYQARIEELQVAQQYPDYAEVIQKYTAPLINQKPHLYEGIQGSKNKALFAYELGKMYQQQQHINPAPTPTLPSQNAQRIVENARKPGTLSSAGGQSTLSKADYYASMSDAEFMRVANKHLGEI